MTFFKKLIRSIVAIISSPAIWLLIVAEWLFSDYVNYLDDSDSILRGWVRWVTFDCFG